MKRPDFKGTERTRVLALKSANHWSLSQTESAMLLHRQTVYAWEKKLRESDGECLLEFADEPVNKYGDTVRNLIKHLSAYCPALGKEKMADILSRAGFHLAASTIGRIRKGEPTQPLESKALFGQPEHGSDNTLPNASDDISGDESNIVKAKYPNHIWHMDLTAVPVRGGFWVP